jgi:tetratricopeptide (TPR) repeat protein
MSQGWTLGNITKQETNNRFVGRHQERQLFQNSLERTLGLKHTSNPTDFLYPHIFLVVGLGGMGKSTLIEQFRGIAHEKKVSVVFLDVENKSVADEDGILKHLHDAAKAELGNEAYKALESYRNALEERERVRRKIESEKASQYDKLVDASAKVVSALAPSPMAPVVEEGVKLAVVKGASALAGLEDNIVDWMRRRQKLNDDEYNLVTDPSRLTSKFMQGLGSIAGNSPLVVIIDTYEKIDRFDEWFRQGLLQSSPYILWIIAGREGKEFLRNYRATFGEQASLFLSEMEIDVFAPNEIASYLTSRNVRISEEEQAKLVLTIQSLSYGVPLAVEALFNMYSQGLDIRTLVDSSDHTREKQEVIRRLTHRFLKWCDEENTTDVMERDVRRYHKRWIEALAILGKYDRQVIKVLAEQIDLKDNFNPDTMLQELGDRYSFIFGNDESEMHELVREVLRDFYRRPSHLSHWLQSVSEVSTKYYEQILDELEITFANNRRSLFRDKRYQEICISMLNALLWQDRLGRKAMAFLVPKAVESYFFSPLFLNDLLKVVSEFLEVMDQKYQTVYEQWTQILDARKGKMDADHPGEKVWIELASPTSSWNLGLTAQALTLIMRARFLCAHTKYQKAYEYYEKADDIISLSHLNELIPLFARELINLLLAIEPVNKAPIICDIALVAATKLVELEPNEAMSHNLLGGIYLFVHDNLEQAELCYQRALEIEADSISAHLGLGIILQHRQQLGDALKEFESIVNKNPDIAPVHSMIGQIHLLENQVDLAEETWLRAVKLDPKFPSSYINLSRLYNMQEDYEKAKGILEKGIGEIEETEPKYLAPLYTQLAYTYLFMGQQEEAIRFGVQSTKLDGNSSAIHEEMGNVYFDCGKFREAVVSYKKAIELDSRNYEALLSLADTYSELGDVKKGLEVCDAAIDLKRNNPRGFYTKGRVYYDDQQYDNALEIFRSALSVDPNFIPLQDYTGRSLFKLHRYDEAYEQFAKILDKYPNNIITKGNLADVLMRMHRYEEALDEFQDSQTIDPEHIPTYIGAAHALVVFDRFDEALELCTRAFDLEPNNPDVHDAIGNVYTYQGKFTDALNAVSKAIELNPSDIGFYQNRGLIYSYMGDYDKAIIDFRTTLKNRKSEDTYAVEYNLAVASYKIGKGIAAARRLIEQARTSLNTLQADKYLITSAQYGIGGLSALLGDRQTAISNLRKAILGDQQVRLWARYDPAWISLREEPDFKRLMW